MSDIGSMIPGQRYLAGDGYGYEFVWCLEPPTHEEIMEHMGDHPSGTYVKIRYEEGGATDIWFDATGYTHTYCEPAPLGD